MSDDDQKKLMEELVNAPYGEAEMILKKRGLWNDKLSTEDGVKRTYRVRVIGEIRVESIIKVEATSEEEASDMAEDKARDYDFHWQEKGAPEVIDVEIVGREG